jgi:hypothetical protein
MNLAEVVDQLVRARGHDFETVRDRIHLLMAGGLEVEPVWLPVTWLATSLRADHYRRARTLVSLADCICVAMVHGAIRDARPGSKRQDVDWLCLVSLCHA